MFWCFILVGSIIIRVNCIRLRIGGFSFSQIILYPHNLEGFMRPNERLTTSIYLSTVYCSKLGICHVFLWNSCLKLLIFYSLSHAELRLRFFLHCQRYSFVLTAFFYTCDTHNITVKGLLFLVIFHTQIRFNNEHFLRPNRRTSNFLLPNPANTKLSPSES